MSDIDLVDRKKLLSLVDTLEQQLLDGVIGAFDTLEELRQALGPSELNFEPDEPEYYGWHHMVDDDEDGWVDQEGDDDEDRE